MGEEEIRFHFSARIFLPIGRWLTFIFPQRQRQKNGGRKMGEEEIHFHFSALIFLPSEDD